MRQSIQPTYDHRETGDRYSVEYRVNGRSLGETSITDPFVRGSVTVSWRDVLRSLLQRKRLRVEFTVRGDTEIENDVMELDANYLAYNSTRKRDFQEHVEQGLRRLAMTPDDEELN